MSQAPPRAPTTPRVTPPRALLGPATLLTMLLVTPRARLAGPGGAEGAIKGAEDNAEWLGEKALFEIPKSAPSVAVKVADLFESPCTVTARARMVTSAASWLGARISSARRSRPSGRRARCRARIMPF